LGDDDALEVDVAVEDVRVDEELVVVVVPVVAFTKL
jgi:hypothetical protein